MSLGRHSGRQVHVHGQSPGLLQVLQGQGRGLGSPQVARQRVRSTTEGELVLNSLLAGEGSSLGEMVRVPHWGVDEVLSWVASVGFKEFCPVFKECGVDGDLLLMLSDHDCQEDLGMKNGILRRRFLRELAVLRKNADYSSCGGEEMANFLNKISPEFRGYTYSLVTKDISLEFLTQLSGDELQEILKEAGITNSVHRHRLVEALDNLQDDLLSDSGLQSDLGTPEVQYDVYLTHPQGQGEELASLIKIQLELRGFNVYGESHLPGNTLDRSITVMQDIRHFLLILPPNALDLVEEDDNFRRELATALQLDTNIVPVTDNFQWPEPDSLPEDIRAISYFNCVRWVHDYQDACVLKIERFLRGDCDVSRGPSPYMSGARTPNRPSLPSGFSTPGGLSVPRQNRRVSEQRLTPTPHLLLPKRGWSRSCVSLYSLDSGTSGC